MLFGWKHLTGKEESQIAQDIIQNHISRGPYHLELQPTNRCNVNCFFCSSKPSRNAEILPWEILKKTIEQSSKHNLRFIRLSGGGESLIYPSIQSLLDLLHNLNLRLVDVTTNGVTLTKLSKRILDVGIDVMSISLNEPTAPLYSKAMNVQESVFHQIINGINIFNELRNLISPYNRPEIHLKFFLWKNNYNYLSVLHKLGISLSVDKIMINSISFLDNDLRITSEELPNVKARLKEIIQEDCRSEHYKLSFNLREEKGLQEFVEYEQAKLIPQNIILMPDVIYDKERFEYCFMGWYSATISASGKVYPCCNFVGDREKELGNILDQPLELIWKGKPFRKFRKEFRSLVFLDRKFEYSKKFYNYLTPFCIGRRNCPFAYYLCSSKFYKKVTPELVQNFTTLERISLLARNYLLINAHHLRKYF